MVFQKSKWLTSGEVEVEVYIADVQDSYTLVSHRTNSNHKEVGNNKVPTKSNFTKSQLNGKTEVRAINILYFSAGIIV